MIWKSNNFQALYQTAVVFRNYKLYDFGWVSPVPLLRPGSLRTIEVFYFEKHNRFVYFKKITKCADDIYGNTFFNDLEKFFQAYKTITFVLIATHLCHITNSFVSQD